MYSSVSKFTAVTLFVSCLVLALSLVITCLCNVRSLLRVTIGLYVRCRWIRESAPCSYKRWKFCFSPCCSLTFSSLPTLYLAQQKCLCSFYNRRIYNLHLLNFIPSTLFLLVFVQAWRPKRKEVTFCRLLFLYLFLTYNGFIYYLFVVYDNV
jgi:hypothetical protein